MEPFAIAVRKRKPENEEPLCFICASSKGKLRKGTLEGKERIKLVAQQRRLLNDISNVLERIDDFTEAEWIDTALFWHKDCYSSFTSQTILSRLSHTYHTNVKAAVNAHPEAGIWETHDDQPNNAEPEPERQVRRKTSMLDTTLCMFCQRQEKHQLHAVCTMNVSNKILKLSALDATMRTRLANVTDVIAAEGKYHLPCWVNFQRTTLPKSKERTCTEISETLQELLEDITLGLQKGYVYNMNEVYNYYLEKCVIRGEEIPNKYQSRATTFYNDIEQTVTGKGVLVRPFSKNRSPLLCPNENEGFLITSDNFTETMNVELDSTDRATIPMSCVATNSLQEIVHTALQIRSDLNEMPGHKEGWSGIDTEHVKALIPESLHVFLSILLDGLVDWDDENASEDSLNQMYSLAQDMIYAVSKKRKLTPKHIGLGLTLHQATRSEKLVNLFHAAGHTVGMDTIRRMDTSMAVNILNTFEENDHVFVPQGIEIYEPGRLILASFDNIDVLEETIDGKNTFHCTQMALWQRGPCTSSTLPAPVKIGRERSLRPDWIRKLHQLDSATFPRGKRPQPTFKDSVFTPNEWFSCFQESSEAQYKTHTWLLYRLHDSKTESQSVPSWASFNEIIGNDRSEITYGTMLPILQSPSDNDDTVTTVLNRFSSITRRMQQKHTVIAGDLPLYSRAKQIIWSNPGKYDDTVMIMGHLHILFNFLKVIGQHFENAGIDDIWIDTDLFAPNSTVTMLNGKAYYRAVRGHLWTYEAFWRIKWDKILAWLSNTNYEISEDVKRSVSSGVELFHRKRIQENRDDLVESVEGTVQLLRKSELKILIREFDTQNASDPNFVLWSEYLNMVEILLHFIRANREGNWKLHLEAFSAMLPWITIYDHGNYARFGAVYLCEMQNLERTAPEVFQEFMAGNFVVKQTKGSFNQVPLDQATEWMNSLCKRSYGIIGITRVDSARDRFCITWAERSRVSLNTKLLFHLEEDEEAISTRKEDLPSRMKNDENAVNKLKLAFEKLRLFSPSSDSELISLITRDIASLAVKTDLLSARSKGVALSCTLILERIQNQTKHLLEPISRNNPKTFASMYNVSVSVKNNEKKEIKSDRKVISRLLTASVSGRKINLDTILTHELSTYPRSLAKADGSMNSNAKSDLLMLLLQETKSNLETTLPTAIDPLKTCVLIDGHALVQAIGKPSSCSTFGHLSNTFSNVVFGSSYRNHAERVDVIFDRYDASQSIKTFTRQKRSKSIKRQIRTKIDSENVPVPVSWGDFISVPENKASLSHFLSSELVKKGENRRDEFELCTAGGFEESDRAQSTRRQNIQHLCGQHEEADTRLILHAIDAVQEGYQRIVIFSQDTDVLILMIYFLGRRVREVYMAAGSSSARKYYPVHEISSKLSPLMVRNLLAFHAFTGCDTTSSFGGLAKKSCWKEYVKHPHLLTALAEDESSFMDIEEFVCRLYKAPDVTGGVNKARSDIFQRGKREIEMLPPTKDALQLHTARARYQTKIWSQAYRTSIAVESCTDSLGWFLDEDENLQVKWTTIPAIPAACLQLSFCGCTKKCRYAKCRCVELELACTPACGCQSEGCKNPNSLE